MNMYWYPRYKWQLVEWLHLNVGMNRTKASRMNKTRLYAIYWQAIRKFKN